MSNSYPCSVILAAHGSIAEPDVNAPLFELAEQIADSEIFSVVTPAFLHGQPQLTNVFETIPPGDVVVIPVMASEGYYVKTVFPEKLAENRDLGRYRIFHTPALGVHPELASLVADRVEALMSTLSLSQAETTTVLIGHGTPRHPNSSRSTYQLADRLSEHLPDLNVAVGFIDQQPSMTELVDTIQTPNRLVIPFLISRGPHATVDVPQAFGLPTGPDIEFPLADCVAGGVTVCDLPVGMYPEIRDVCIEMATDALLSWGDGEMGRWGDQE